MPTFNHAPYIDEAIASLVAQSYPHWELIVVDDGSTDETPTLLGKWMARDSRIRVLRTRNGGPGPARNLAIREATNDWVAFLDSDDLWMPDALASHNTYLDEHPECQFCFGHRDRLRDGIRTVLTSDRAVRPLGPLALFRHSAVLTSSVVCLKAMAMEAGGFDERFNTAEDYSFFLRVSLRTPLHPIGVVTATHRRHGTNLSSQTGDTRMIDALLLERFAWRMAPPGTLPWRSVKRRLGKVFWSAGRLYFREGQFGKSRRALAESLHYKLSIRAALGWSLAALLGPVGRDGPDKMPEV